MKDAFYFPHFCNARHDRKIKRVRKELGIEGYGIYFMILEVLREQSDLRYPMDEIDLLADEFGTSEQKVRTVICNYSLFEVDETEHFFSLKFIEFLTPYFKMKEQRAIAGKISAEKRKLRKENSTTVQQPFNDRTTDVQQSKVKETKESKVKETNEINENENFVFKINSEKIYTSPSNWLKEFAQSYVDNLMMKCSLTLEEKTRLLSDVYKRMDSEYSYYDFNNHNHVKNAFKGILDKLMLTEKTNYNKLSVNGSSTF